MTASALDGPAAYLHDSLARLGRAALAIAADAGGMARILTRAMGALLPPRVDRDELMRCLHHFGLRSLPIIAATAAFVGAIMVLQAATYVRLLGAGGLVGWMSGIAIMREVGPVFIALMFSGRVGANNTAELASMRVTEQITALEVLAIDVYAYLVTPRLFAMVLTLAALLVLGDLAALLTGAATAALLLGIEPQAFYASLATYVRLEDFLVGVLKAGVFGCAIAVTSSHYGLAARGGAQAVGRAVNAQVVASAVLIFVLDYLMTSTVR